MAIQNLINKISQSLHFLFEIRKSQCISIDISSNNVRILQLSKQKNRYRIENIICKSIVLQNQNNKNKDEETIIQQLKNIIEENRLKSHPTIIAIHYSGIITKTITLPHKLNENEIEEFLALNIEQHINITVDKLGFDYHIIETPKLGTSTIELIAARTENINTCVNLLKRAHLKAKAIDVDAYALFRASNLLPLNTNEPCAIINLENEKILVVLFKQNKLIYAQEYFIDNQFFNQCQTLAKQISNNLQLCLTAINQPINTIVLCGTYANTSGLSEYLKKTSHTNIILADPFHNLTFANHIDKSMIIAKAPEMMLCCGLALWEKYDFNLLPWRQELRNKKQKNHKLLICLCILLGVLLVSIWHFTIKQKINSAITEQHKLTPQTTALKLREKQIKITNNNITAVKVKLDRIKNLRNNQIKNVELLISLSQITPPAIYLLNLQKNDNDVMITGQTTNLSAITEFIQKISKESLFVQSQIQEIKNISEQENIFTIKINLKRSDSN